ncbi:MAG: XisH family protein [Anaerolineae bacterium]|nr:XisH family protein [Anaerolineae bacterium]
MITHDPYIITSKDDDKLIIDLGAEMPICSSPLRSL